jgi:flagellar protein FlaJ
VIRGAITEIQSLLTSADLEYDPWDFTIVLVVLGESLGIGAAVLSGLPLGLAALLSFAVFLVFIFSSYALLVVLANRRIAVIEEMLPDFLSIIASNIKSGLTYDRALLVSARKEFGPLAKEVNRAAKETLSGKPLPDALMSMAERLRSEQFAKAMRLIVEGINSGGKLADLLENTASDIRRFSAVRKDVSATVRVYQLFVLSAAAIGAPLLYAVTNVLVGTIDSLRAKMGTGEGGAQLSFFQGSASISADFLFWFSIAGLVITGLFSALASGVISRGKESDGYTYVPLIILVSLCLFLFARLAMQSLFSGIVF